MLRRSSLNPIAALLPLIVLTFAFASVVRAAVDVTVGSGTPASCTQAALQAAVSDVNSANGGGTITFNCGGAYTIPLTQQLRFETANAAYVLDGGGLITLDGQESTRLIYTLSGRNLSLTVRNIALINGRANSDPADERAANQGGAIYSGYRNFLTVEGVTFNNNRALGDRHPYHGGGAIAIDTTSVVTITDSVFNDNRSPNGGAINNLLSSLTIERSVFTANRATRDDPGGGGAIYNDAGKLTIKDSHILNNISANLGGGIFSWAHDVNGSYSGKTVIKNTVLDGNTARFGGGLWKGGAYVLKMTNSSVTNNTAERGAGIAGTGPGKDFAVVNTTIAYNSLLTPGSAAGIFTTAGSTVKNVTLAFNTMPNDGTSVGAAIHGVATFTNTIFLGNTGGWNGIRTCDGSISNGGGNIQYPGGSCGGGIPVKDALLDLTLQPPLGSLALGQTQTLALMSGSPAFNKASNCPGKDQRGVTRPQGDKCDIGAVEMEGFAPATPVITYPLNNATGVPAQPVFTWDAAAGAADYKLKVKKPNGDTWVKAVLTPFDAGCASGCSYNFAASGKSLKPGKTYTLIVQARNDFGKRKAKVSFTAG